MGRSGSPASLALPGRPRFRAAAADGSNPGRWLLAAERHARAHRGRGRDSAGHSDCGDRHAILHLAAGQHAEDLVVNIEGRDLTIGYPDHTVGRGLDVALSTGEVLALLGPNGGGKTPLLKTLLRLLKPKARNVRLGDRLLHEYTVREPARDIAYRPPDH